MAWQSPPIPKGGMAERVAATIKARFGYWPTAYLACLKGAPPPKHVVDLSIKLARERPWDPDKPVIVEAPPDPWAWTKKAL